MKQYPASYPTRWLGLLLAGLVFLLGPSNAAAIDDPSLDYKTLETEHFYVHYYEKIEKLAHKTAEAAEESHTILVPLLDNEPTSKTHIVVGDKSDTANGSATVYGRNLIRIYGMPPTPDGVLGYYDDWLRILVFHEYVHILQLDTASNFSEYLNLVIGERLHPNAVLPRWYVEGLAVMHESHRTGTGRLQSSLFGMWLRTAALYDEFFDLGRATGFPSDWPHGTTPYLYGGFFLQYVSDRLGDDFTTEFNHLYGSRNIPFSLNKTARDVGGKGFDEMWEEWTAHAKAEATARYVEVRAKGATPVESITEKGGNTGDPRLRPGSDEISFLLADQESHPRFAVNSAGRDRVDDLFEVDGVESAHTWTPDGDTLVYARTTIEENVYAYNDLFAWHAPTDKRWRLTNSERARGPDISPDGRHIAYARNREGTMELVVCRWHDRRMSSCRVVAGGHEQTDDPDAGWHQFGQPSWSPDGRSIVFSWWRLDERKRDLWIYDLPSEERTSPDTEHSDRLRRLTDDAAMDLDPHWGDDGHIYFSSDRTGIYNIYATDVSDAADGEEVWQLSHVVTGVFAPQPSANGKWLYVTKYTEDGYVLGRFRRPSRFGNEAPASPPGPLERDYPTVDRSDWESYEYRALPWLGPLLFEPDFGFLQSGAGFGGSINSRDPVGHHSWTLSGGWVTGSELTDYRASLGLRYAYSGWPIDVTLAGRFEEFPRTRSLVAESRYIPYIEREYTGQLSLRLPFRKIDDRFSLNTTFTLNRTAFADEPEVDHDPADRQPRLPDHGWFNTLRLSLSYNSLDRYAESISTERGVFGDIGVGVQNEAIGSDADNVTFNYTLGGYYPNPLWDKHVFYMRVTGAIASGGRRFALGGHQPQDVLTDLILQQPSGQFVLPGYPAVYLTGEQYQLVSTSYRFPILELDQGFSTLPVFLKRLKGQVYAHAGGAFNGYLADADYRTSIGGEVQMSMNFGYYLGGTLQLGYARGLEEGGINEWYFLFGGGF